MIYNLFILTKSGITIFYKTYSPKSIIKNDVMVAAFFSAMHSFSDNLTGRGLDILHVGDRKFLVRESEDLLFIVLLDCDDSVPETDVKLNIVKDFMYKNYSKYIKKKTFDGNLEPFMEIEPKIDKIILDKPIGKTKNKVVETLEKIKKLVNTRKKGTKAKLNKFLDEKIKEARTES